MVKLPILSFTIIGILTACAPAWAQEASADACTPTCTDTASGIQACGEYNAECVCSTKIIEQVADCRKCITDSGLIVAEVDVLGNHTQLCKTLGIIQDDSPIGSTTTPGATATPEISAIANVANAAPTSSNSATDACVHITLGILTAWVGLALGAQL